MTTTLHGTIGFLGYGNMASAILEGLIEQGVLGGRMAAVYDPDPARMDAARHVSAHCMESAEELGGMCDTLVLAVKPQTMEGALRDLAPGLKPDTLVISIAAGINIAWLAERLNAGQRIIRVMPNTPALVQAGAAGIAPGPGCTDDDLAVARTVFEAIGVAEVVEERDMDAVTALSGSGPAYFFYMVEGLVKAAVAEGLNEATATRLAAQTLFGAGQLLQRSDASAAVLRERVTSKGGTTEAALRTFQAEGFERVVAAGVHAAAERSR